MKRFAAMFALLLLTTCTSSTPEALQTLSQAVEAGFREKAYILSDPDLQSLRDRAEFKAVVAKL